MNSKINGIVQYIKNKTGRFSIKQGFNGTIIEIHSNEACALQWLKDYHIGYFDIDIENSANIVIYGLYVDNNIFQSILNIFTFTSKIQMFFQHDGYTLEYEQYRIYYDIESQYIHIVQENTHFILVLSKEKDSFRIIERIQKEIFFSEISEQHIRFHAAAICNVHNEGSLVVGPKGSGKTTLALGAMNKGAKFGANDRIEVYKNIYNQLVYCGVPTSVRLDKEQVKFIQRIRGKTLKPKSFSDLGVYRNKIEYSPQEISRYFNVKIMNECILKNIIIPKFNFKEIKVSKVTNIEYIYQILFENVFLVDNAFSPYFVEKNNVILENFIFQILTRTKCYMVEGWLYDFDIHSLVE